MTSAIPGQDHPGAPVEPLTFGGPSCRSVDRRCSSSCRWHSASRSPRRGPSPGPFRSRRSTAPKNRGPRRPTAPSSTSSRSRSTSRRTSPSSAGRPWARRCSGTTASSAAASVSPTPAPGIPRHRGSASRSTHPRAVGIGSSPPRTPSSSTASPSASGGSDRSSPSEPPTAERASTTCEKIRSSRCGSESGPIPSSSPAAGTSRPRST